MPQLEYKRIPFEVKEVKEDGTFSGYASVYDVVDSDKERVLKGAFTKSLTTGRKVRMLWQHDYREPIGPWRELSETDKGLFADGKLTLGVQRAKEAHALMLDDALDGMSIGAMFKLSEPDGDDIVDIYEADLWEISVVTFPANLAAVIEDVKSALESKDPRFARVIERALHDLGLSRKQAVEFTEAGLARVSLSDSGSLLSESDVALEGLTESLLKEARNAKRCYRQAGIGV